MLINCIGGIGDILYCEPIYRSFWNKEGVKPHVIIHDHQMYLQDYIESAEFIKLSENQQYKDDAIKTDNYLPLRFANPIVRGLDKFDYSDFENCMPDKYILAELDPELWLTLSIKFNEEKGIKLCDILGIDIDNDNYIVINENSQAGKIKIDISTDNKIIYVKEIDGYTILDWCLIFQYANANYHISTSTFYIFEALQYLCGSVFLYKRPNKDGLRGISKLNPTFNCIKVNGNV